MCHTAHNIFHITKFTEYQTYDRYDSRFGGHNGEKNTEKYPPPPAWRAHFREKYRQ